MPLKSLLEKSPKDGKFAYVWYTSFSNEYLCAALTALHLLQLARKLKSPLVKVDYVLITINETLKTVAANRKKQKLIQKWKALGKLKKYFICHS